MGKGGHIDSTKFQQTKKHSKLGQTFNKFKQFCFFVAKGRKGLIERGSINRPLLARLPLHLKGGPAYLRLGHLFEGH
jgi:hypothetical protein